MGGSGGSKTDIFIAYYLVSSFAVKGLGIVGRTKTSCVLQMLLTSLAVVAVTAKSCNAYSLVCF